MHTRAAGQSDASLTINGKTAAAVRVQVDHVEGPKVLKVEHDVSKFFSFSIFKLDGFMKTKRNVFSQKLKKLKEAQKKNVLGLIGTWRSWEHSYLVMSLLGENLESLLK